MADSRGGTEDRGGLERLGAATGAMAGKAADFGLEMTGALFRSAAETLGGWWTGDGPLRAAESFADAAEQDCRTHYGRTASDPGRGRDGVGAQSPTSAAGKSASAAMKADRSGVGGSARVGNAGVSGEAHLDRDADDGFDRARPGYQLGWVAKQNPAYRNRSFTEVEPELREVWETRTPGADEGDGSPGLWPDVRGYVDYAYGREDTRR